MPEENLMHIVRLTTGQRPAMTGKLDSAQLAHFSVSQTIDFIRGLPTNRITAETREAVNQTLNAANVAYTVNGKGVAPSTPIKDLFTMETEPSSSINYQNANILVTPGVIGGYTPEKYR